MRPYRVSLLILAAILAAAQPATKSITPIRVQRKIALVIGNSRYRNIPVIEPALADANDFAATLRTQLQFDTVEVHTDLDAEALIATINKFARTQIHDGDLALLYYSGHGGQAGEENYLLPIDYAPPSEDDLVERRGGFRMSRVRDAFESKGARVRVLIFDACRNSPVTSTKSGVGGLKQLEGKPEGTFIAYASAHNQASRFDRGERNSFYTAELLDELRSGAARDLESVFKQVQLRVYQRTKGIQRPYVYGFLSGPVYLGPVSAAVRQPAPVVSTNTCADAWSMVKDSSDAVALKAFTADFGECASAVRLANLRVRTLERPRGPTSAGGPTTTVPPVTKENKSPRVNPKDGLTYVWIPPGVFEMGCSPSDDWCSDSEKPTKSEKIDKGFWLGESEVTQAAYQKVTGNNPSSFKGPDLPVESVDWRESAAYCKAIGGRLLTEPEWEYVARAGTVARFGARDQWPDLDKVAWYAGNSKWTTHPAKQKEPNAWGVYDMLGNVWEWTASDYGSGKALRGGSFNDLPPQVRASVRTGWVEPTGRDRSIGFRCAWE